MTEKSLSFFSDSRKMGEKSFTFASDRFDCSICLEAFKRPKLLPCHHTFCAVCLENYIYRTRKGDTFRCPLCRKSITVPSKGVDGFQANFYLDTGSSDGKEERGSCNGCGKKASANHRCLDCEENFCQKCTAVHMNMKLTRGHKLKAIRAGMQVEEKIMAKMFCTQHPEKEIEIYCRHCNQLVCAMCFLPDHRGHRSRSVAEEAREIRRKMNNFMDDSFATDAIQRQIDLVQSLHKKEVNLKSSLDQELKTLKDHGSRLHKAIDNIIKNLEDKLMNKYEKAISEIYSRVEKSEKFCLSLKSLMTTAGQVIAKATGVEMVEKGGMLFDQLQKERREEPKTSKALLENAIGPLYVKGLFEVDSLEEMVGRINPDLKLSRKVFPIEDKMRRLSSFVSTREDNMSVYGLAPVGKDRAWITFDDDNLCLVDIKGKLLFSVKTGTACYSVSADDSDNCVISCRNDRSIKRVTKSGNVEDLVPETDGIPWGVAFRKRTDGKKDVLFTCTGSEDGGGSVFVVPYRSDAKVTVFSTGYTKPLSLSVDAPTGRVCVGDWSEHTVTILDQNKQVIGTYKDSGFSPFGVCFDHQGCIFLTASNLTTPVRRIKPDGTFLEVLINIRGARAAKDSEGRIWLVRNKKTIDIYKIQ